MLGRVILSGGSRTRLRPLSRKNLPKRFLALAGDTTLFQQTVVRNDEVFPVTKSQTTFPRLRPIRRLRNPGKMRLGLIEAQSGSHLSDVDIAWIEDVYGRS